MLKFVSCRRFYLDHLLSLYSYLMQGYVVDIGGHRSKRRGFFVQPNYNVSQWIYLNPDSSTDPDIECTLPDLPLKSV